METNQRLKQNLAVLITKRSKAILKHILSPLEQTAMRRNYEPFTFNLDGVRVYISSNTCKHLVTITTQKAELLLHAIQTEKLAKGIPHKLREVFSDPRIILSLPPRLRNRLCRVQCYTLFAIMQKGRAFFIEEQKFGKKAMETLDGLFAKYNCSQLFV